MVEYEYRVLSFPRDVSRSEVRRTLSDHAEYGHWELHRTRIYLVLALAVSLGSWVITGSGGDHAYRLVLIWWPLCCAVAAVLLLRRHRARSHEAAANAGITGGRS